MSSTTHISEENMKYNSVLATQTALVDLGRHEQMRVNSENQQEITNELIIKILENYQQNLNNNKTHIPKTEISEIINKSLEHIMNLNKIIENEKSKNIKLQAENKDFEEETKDLIKQTEALEYKIENYWEKRVKNLRDKCGKKNNYIKALKCCMLFAISQHLLISYFGFLRYYYIIAQITVGTANLLYLMFNCVYLGFHDIAWCIYLLQIRVGSLLYSGYLYQFNIFSVLYTYTLKNVYSINSINNVYNKFSTPELGVNISNGICPL